MDAELNPTFKLGVVCGYVVGPADTRTVIHVLLGHSATGLQDKDGYGAQPLFYEHVS